MTAKSGYCINMIYLASWVLLLYMIYALVGTITDISSNCYISTFSACTLLSASFPLVLKESVVLVSVTLDRVLCIEIVGN